MGRRSGRGRLSRTEAWAGGLSLTHGVEVIVLDLCGEALAVLDLGQRLARHGNRMGKDMHRVAGWWFACLKLGSLLVRTKQDGLLDGEKAGGHEWRRRLAYYFVLG